MVSQSLYRLGFLTYYSLNVSEVSEKYCVNRDKPDLCCQGKCYVSKQMEDKEQIPSSGTSVREEMPLFEVADSPNDLEPFMTYVFQISDFRVAMLLDGYLQEMEHPPLA